MEQLCTNCRLRIKRNAVILIKRQLRSSQGNIKVQVGQEVKPEDVLGDGQNLRGIRTINLASELQVNPKKAIFYLKKQIGQNIYKGELLAFKDEVFGFKKKILLSPTDGVIDSITNDGILRIRLSPKTSRLLSGVNGIVDKVNQQSGTIAIRTVADIIWGMFGTGGEREGIVKVIDAPETLISSRQIKGEYEKQIIVGGSLIFLDGLKEAVILGVAGVVSGGIDARDYKTMAGGGWGKSFARWSDVGLSVVVTEGFGSIPIGNDIFSVLKEHDGKFVLIDGNKGLIILPNYGEEAMMYIRRNNIPETVGILTPAVDTAALEIGMKVRILSQPLVGIQGKIIAIDQNMTQLPSGITTHLITVETKYKKVRVPYPNIEVLR